MSNTQFAFIEKSAVPDRSTLQASIDSLGFDLQLHPEYTPFDDSGFMPCVLNGKEGFGFEIYYQNAREVIGESKAIEALAAGRNYCISMVWHSSTNDLACAMIVSCALANDFGAIVSYEGNPPETVESMLASANQFIHDGENEQPPTPKVVSTLNQSNDRKPWWKLW